MRMIVILMTAICFVLGCESKPQEATEVPEDLMREIAMEAARETIRVDGPAILMMEARDTIQQQARQAAADTARQVAGDECRKALQQANNQQLELRVQELENQVQKLRSMLTQNR
jgi:hypothetical protein